MATGAPRGRPPKPTERHRLTGRANGTKTADGRDLPVLAEVMPLPMASGVPEPPTDLGLNGRDLWTRVWTAGLTWISPTTDQDALVEACRLQDDLAIAREMYRATRDPKHGTLVVKLNGALTVALSNLGFNPVARTRLGVAEVKRVSKIDELRQRQQDRASGV